MRSFAWFAWTQNARPNVFHVPKYTPPPFAILAGVLLIIVLIALAYSRRRADARPSSATASAVPHPWLVVLIVLILGFPWYFLMALVFAPATAHGIAFWVFLILGVAWATLAYVLVNRWSSSSAWTGLHRWALVFGAILVNMSAGFLGSSTWPHRDLYFKIALNVLAVALLLFLARRISHRSATST